MEMMVIDLLKNHDGAKKGFILEIIAPASGREMVVGLLGQGV